MSTQTKNTDQIIDTEARAQELVKKYADAVHLYNEIVEPIQKQLEQMDEIEAELREIKSEMRELGQGSYDGFSVSKAPVYADLDYVRENLSERSLKALRPDNEIDVKKLKALYPNVYSKSLKPGTARVTIR